MAECLEEAIGLLAPYCASQSQVVLGHLDVIATIAAALYQERMSHAVPVVSDTPLSHGAFVLQGATISCSGESSFNSEHVEGVSNDRQEMP